MILTLLCYLLLYLYSASNFTDAVSKCVWHTAIRKCAIVFTRLMNLVRCVRSSSFYEWWQRRAESYGLRNPIWNQINNWRISRSLIRIWRLETQRSKVQLRLFKVENIYIGKVYSKSRGWCKNCILFTSFYSWFGNVFNATKLHVTI